METNHERHAQATWEKEIIFTQSQSIKYGLAFPFFWKAIFHLAVQPIFCAFSLFQTSMPIFQT